ncbi:unnamed protein product, partial [Closterium sp. NIES-53]
MSFPRLLTTFPRPLSRLPSYLPPYLPTSPPFPVPYLPRDFSLPHRYACSLTLDEAFILSCLVNSAPLQSPLLSSPFFPIRTPVLSPPVPQVRMLTLDKPFILTCLANSTSVEVQ